MKIKFFNILASSIVFLLCLMTLQSMAQDEGVPAINPQESSHQEINLNEEKPAVVEHEIKTPRSSPGQNKDSVQTKTQVLLQPAKSKSAENNKPSSKEEEDALSFNFLYYIIHKFKYSDLVD